MDSNDDLKNVDSTIDKQTKLREQRAELAETFDMPEMADPPARHEATCRVQIGFIDPARLKNYQRDEPQLEEFLCYCVLSVGRKDAHGAAVQLNSLLITLHQRARLTACAPFEALRLVPNPCQLAGHLKSHGIGDHELKAAALYNLAASGLCLNTCELSQLEDVAFVGLASPRMFLLYSRPRQQMAVLDDHALRHLEAHGVEAPGRTPEDRARYLTLEKEFLRLAKKAEMTPADFDRKVRADAR